MRLLRVFNKCVKSTMVHLLVEVSSPSLEYGKVKRRSARMKPDSRARTHKYRVRERERQDRHTPLAFTDKHIHPHPMLHPSCQVVDDVGHLALVQHFLTNVDDVVEAQMSLTTVCFLTCASSAVDSSKNKKQGHGPLSSALVYELEQRSPIVPSPLSPCQPFLHPLPHTLAEF